EEVAEGLEVTLRFDRAGGVSGRAGCNRFSGSYVLSGEGMTIDPGAATMMACPEPAMALERQVFDALGRVGRFDLSADGGLSLMGGGETLLRAQR
ncbi:META domain-containing protein, partial [Cribrihabitans sp. XS_ASV171]